MNLKELKEIGELCRSFNYRGSVFTDGNEFVIHLGRHGDIDELKTASYSDALGHLTQKFIANRGIKTGSVVKLKSGGPEMTVIGKDGNKWACEWFHEHRPEPANWAFTEGALELLKW